MKIRSKCTKAVLVLTVSLLGMNTAWGKSFPSPVTFDLSLDKPVLHADQPQTAYLRIALKGLCIEREQSRPPVNIAIVIDKSGSMGGEKIAEARKAAILAVERLGGDDIISVVTYDSGVNVLIPATKATDKESICQLIRSIQAGGSTALYDGVSQGGRELKKFLEPGRVNRMLLLSDGLANVGPQTPDELGRLGGSLIEEGISVTTIGLGLGYNEDLMTQLAYKSDGSHYFAEQATDLAGVFNSEFNRALAVVAQEIQIEIVCPAGIRPVRLLGRQGQIQGQTVKAYINQLFSQSEKYLLLEMEVPPMAGDTARTVAAVRINYGDMNTHTTQEWAGSTGVTFSADAKRVESNTNARVMVDVVEQIAIERNKMALQLRDQGETQKAEEMLKSNASYLKEYGAKYNAPKLDEYAEDNRKDADNLDENNWTRQRKSMRASQFQRETQQSN
ncbi:MAG: von Willebrand factor type A domain protein [Planctomycetes bacterium ADurb.Bin412]|nr:MAG: von Willebrand factor type A domain protein [Planctomycetes bacterium ADurb.Bin412]